MIQETATGNSTKPTVKQKRDWREKWLGIVIHHHHSAPCCALAAEGAAKSSLTNWESSSSEQLWYVQALRVGC